MAAVDSLILVSGIFILIATLVPFIRNDYWVFRVFEYPRLQKWVLNTILLLLAAFVQTGDYSTFEQIVYGGLILNWLYLSYLIYPFTFFSRVQIIKGRTTMRENRLKILIANVYQDNRQADSFHQLFSEQDPDVILLVETNTWWQDKMEPLSGKYPWHVHVPLENTYGMLLYSRLELKQPKVQYLIKNDIPSIEVKVSLPSGQLVQLYCLHPEPPVPQENPRSTERDQEILLVGAKAKQSKIPVIVMGDLNDVAWSYTTKLFSKTSGLVDPRRGRGFFNTFNAKYFFLRFPLDHIFCSPDFELHGIRRLRSCGSDHFPMVIDLAYNSSATKFNETPEPDAEDVELANKKIAGAE